MIVKLVFCNISSASAISQVSMFHMFLYIIAISLKHLQKVFGTRDRERKIMLIGRPDYTNPDSCRDIPGPGGPVEETLE